MTIAWGTLLAKAPPNPNDVVGGWVAFFVVLAMGAAVVFLYFSLKKQLGKVNFEEQTDAERAGGTGGSAAPDGHDVAEPPGQTSERRPPEGTDRPNEA